ncbi:MAG TPA: glycosyl transferase [Spirochaetia bacterium]|nr:MAG: hypothetical protein A2Y41_02375 [Spirochaetes bacterium GWB1_36_13]HCL56875.1 glycosyl transferase [Spirochaetia bacterium]
MEIFFNFLQVINFISWIFLFFYGMHYYYICILFLKKRKHYHLPEVKEIQTYPLVAVQLPIYNELYVVERLLDSIKELDWPKNRLEIQVLDDSTDETKQIVEEKVKKIKEEKPDLNIRIIRRKKREGFKAGALKHGIELTDAEYFPVFDSDFLPEKDFLMKTIPYLMQDKKLAFVQTRWGHTNKDYSAFTYAQALGIDGHFVIEQSARNMNQLWMNFNGTAGVWRREAILDAGNWSGDTLTEDLDLSYRAQLKGWTTLYLPDTVAPAEIPAFILPYKNQQFRWAKGSIQTAKKLIKPIIQSKFSFKNKFEAIVHLTYYSIHFLMILNILTLIPFILYPKKMIVPLYVPIFLFTISMISPVFLTFLAQLHLKNSIWKFIKALPFLFFNGLGITIYIAIAFMEAVLNIQSAFKRTPKHNLSNNKKEMKPAKYKIKLQGIIIVESLFAVFCFLQVYWIAKYIHPVYIYFSFLLGISTIYIIFKTLKDQFYFRNHSS